MHRLVSVLAIIASATVVPVVVGSSAAYAMPGAISVVSGDAAPITLVRDGCGLGFHRGPFGGCRPNLGGFYGGPSPVIVGRRCPPGYHLGPYGRYCHPF